MLKNIVNFNPVRKLGQALLEQKWAMDTTTKKYTCAGRAYFDPLKTWIFVNPRVKDSACSVYQMIVDSCNFIPSPCLGCWKVVVKPSTLFELMALYEFQKKFTANYMGKDRFCKCGIEEREYVPYNYGGYFYCDSEEQGHERYEQVRRGVDKINPSISVTLKRYCTEFELRLGPSDKYVWPDGAEALERRIFAVVDLDSIGPNVTQPQELVESNLGKWIEFAWGRGDHTAIMFNDNEMLYSPCVTYHKLKIIEEE